MMAKRRRSAASLTISRACETERLDVLASILRRDSTVAPGAAKMPDDERAILIELMADPTSEIRRLAQLTEAYVNALQQARSAAAA